MKRIALAAALVLSVSFGIAQTPPGQNLNVPNSSGGGGSSTLTAGTTALSGCTANFSLFNTSTNTLGCTDTQFMISPSGTVGAPGLTGGNAPTTGFYWPVAGGQLGISIAGVAKADYGITTAGTWTYVGPFVLPVGGQFRISNSGGTNGLQLIGNTGATNTIGTLGANEPLQFRTASATRAIISDTTATFNGPFVSSGTAPTSTTGTCVIVAGTRLGGSSAGSFNIPAGTCAAATTIILTAMAAVTNGYACDMHDLTTPAAIFNQTGVLSTTSATFTIVGSTAGAADLVTWKCAGF